MSANQRKHLRFRDKKQQKVDLYYFDRLKQKIPLLALIVNESLSGFACVYVGEGPVVKSTLLYWQETSKILTLCEVIRCNKIEENVYLMAVSIVKK